MLINQDNNIYSNPTLYSQMMFTPPLKKWATFDHIHHPELPLHDYPQGISIDENGQVTFTCFFPNASKVSVAGAGGSMGTRHYEMTKDSEGYWHVTVDYIEPGFHYHFYYVDGIQTINPMAPVGYGCFQPINYFDMPDKEDFYMLKDVPHGEITMELFNCSVNGRTRNCYIYTPPGYYENKTQYYPVLFLQHGVGENETGWVWHGHIDNIMDNLIYEKKCAEMIVVINSAYVFENKPSMNIFPGDFDKMLIEDCITMLNKKYRVQTDRSHMAIAGLSMGSAQAMRTAILHPDIFANVGVFSGCLPITGMDYDGSRYINHPELISTDFDVFYIGAGENEPFWEDTLNKLTELKLLGCGSSLYYTSYPGYHEWDVWRKLAKDFITLLFKGGQTCE